MEIRDSISSFFLSIGFRLIESNASEYFGDYLDIYSNGSINFRVKNDRSILSMDVSNDNKNWHDLTLVKALLYKEINLIYVTNIEEYMAFIQKEFKNIAELFAEKNYPMTKSRLEELGNERAKQMFPRIGK